MGGHGRSGRLSRVTAAAVFSLAVLARGGGTAEPPVPPAAPAPPPITNPGIIAPLMPPEPGAGKGRLTLSFSGNRRWCTEPDDRLVKPPDRPGRPERAEEPVHTFGYQFIVAGIRRGAPHEPVILFESPVFRTAHWRPAGKIGKQVTPAAPGPVLVTPETAGSAAPRGPTAATLVPFWQDDYRCTTVPERFEFDVDPGIYDISVAFDLMNREGGWFHRMVDYLTDVPVEAARQTRIEGVVNTAAGREREVSLGRALLLPPGVDPAGGGP